MPTRNVDLTEQQDRFVDERVGSGRYRSASDVVRAGLLLLERHEDEETAQLDRLRHEVAAGFEAIERGEFVDLRDDELDDYVERIGEEAAAGARRQAG